MELNCVVQNYEWGRKGINSIVAQLMGENACISSNTPYAELWMGTHPNGPSNIKDTKESLLAYIRKDPERHLGANSIRTFGKDLPYLLKVLAIESPLSIQAHPNKTLAKQLHASRPDIYKDANHKPELAIALGDFQALCGFRPFAEIKSLAKELKTMLHPLYGVENIKKLLTGPESPGTVQACFDHLLRQKKDDILANITVLLANIDTGTECTYVCEHKPGSYTNPTWLATYEIDLLRKLNNLYPGDPGCIAIYLLNVLNLKRFQAIYLAANVPHAYLLGDCVEIMACSDNVIRAGLTPKLVDIETLVQMLDYSPTSAKSLIFAPTKENNCTEIFRPPIEDFAIAKIVILKGKKHDFIKRTTATIVLVVEGEGTTTHEKVVRKGMSFFVSANGSFNIVSVKSNMLIFQAMANV